MVVLQNGAQIFPAMLAAIRSARRTITFENFVWHDGRVTRQFAEAFAERAESGVKVHVLQDAFGCRGLHGPSMNLLRRSPAEVEIFRWLQLSRFNLRTHRKLLVARVQVAGGKARVLGDCAIAGVPGTGAEILMDYSGTLGAKTGKLLPSGNVVDSVVLEDGRRVEVTIGDAANPCVFFAAASIGLTGSELADAITADRALIEVIGEIQAKAGERVGMWSDWRAQRLPGIPLAVMVAAPADFVDMNGTLQSAGVMDLRARLVFLGKCHESMAGTGSMCTAAISRVPGSVVHRAVGAEQAATRTLRIGHPLGVMEVKVVAEPGADARTPHFNALGLTRTARRLMAGTIYIPNPTTN